MDYLARLEKEYEETQYQIHRLEKLCEEYVQLDSVLSDIPKKVSQLIMVPLGSVAFVPGHLIHTNEITVLLGENYFAKRSATQAQEIAQRRIEFLKTNIQRNSNQLEQIQQRFDMYSKKDHKIEETANDEIVEIREDYISDEDINEYEEKKPQTL